MIPTSRLQHLGDESVHEELTVTGLAALVESLALLSLATLGRAELERPQEVVGLTEVRADSVDLVNEVLHAHDVVLAEARLDNGVVEEWHALLVDLTESTLVHEVTDRLQQKKEVRHPISTCIQSVLCAVCCVLSTNSTLNPESVYLPRLNN